MYLCDFFDFSFFLVVDPITSFLRLFFYYRFYFFLKLLRFSFKFTSFVHLISFIVLYFVSPFHFFMYIRWFIYNLSQFNSRLYIISDLIKDFRIILFFPYTTYLTLNRDNNSGYRNSCPDVLRKEHHRLLIWTGQI